MTRTWQDDRSVEFEPSNRLAGHYGKRSKYERHYLLTGIPTQVVVPSVSLAALLHSLAGTVLLEMPSSAGLASPVVEPGACSATPRTSAGAMGVWARPETGGEGLAPPRSELIVPGAPTPVRLSITPPVVEELTAEDEGATEDAGGPPPTRPAGVRHRPLQRVNHHRRLGYQNRLTCPCRPVHRHYRLLPDPGPFQLIEGSCWRL